MIEKSQLTEMFEDLRANSNWDVDSDLLWGYFFTGDDKKALNRLSKKFASLKYRLVVLRPDETEPGFWLHVEKVETHSPDSLHERNQALEKLADEYSVNYDGMDVGPPSS